METDYNADGVAAQYQEAKRQPWRSRVEGYSFRKLIGDVRGKRVVDVACGEGHFTRQLADAGAEGVVGVDLSERMIDLARTQEAAEPRGIEYRVEDARDPGSPEKFDLAVAAWLLVYAEDRDDLARMCRGLASRIAPGGRFVTVLTNPDLYAFEPAADYSQYGFTITLEDEVAEGARILWTIELSGPSLDIENRYLPFAAYEEAFTAAGFVDVRFHAMELAPSPDGEDDREYWSTMLDQPPAILLDCVKAG